MKLPNPVRLWARPPLGQDAVRNSTQPIPLNLGNPYQQRIPRNPRGTAFWGEYIGLNYSTGMDHHVMPTLGRQYLYASAYASWAVGGPTYPPDYGFGPGYHGDCMTPQFYMRPGIPPQTQQLLTGGRQL